MTPGGCPRGARRDYRHSGTRSARASATTAAGEPSSALSPRFRPAGELPSPASHPPPSHSWRTDKRGPVNRPRQKCAVHQPDSLVGRGTLAAWTDATFRNTPSTRGSRWARSASVGPSQPSLASGCRFHSSWSSAIRLVPLLGPGLSGRSFLRSRLARSSCVTRSARPVTTANKTEPTSRRTGSRVARDRRQVVVSCGACRADRPSGTSAHQKSLLRKYGPLTCPSRDLQSASFATRRDRTGRSHSPVRGRPGFRGNVWARDGLPGTDGDAKPRRAFGSLLRGQKLWDAARAGASRSSSRRGRSASWPGRRRWRGPSL